ncbi:MAG: fumarylacetoacetate hydrolase family protein, partial [Syntrophales bacterium]|nr:fumarylacetoacetate hydrolase family protein [Syntrophales bacterium]
MKIGRYLSQEGDARWCVFDTAAPAGRAWAVDGHIFGRFTVTEREVVVENLLPPLEPVNIFALGFSYGKHARETGTEAPTEPVVFMKATTSVIAHHDPILLPAAGPERVDYEGELAVVIGRTAKNVPAAAAMDYVFGYTCANDVSARDWQFERQRGQWIRGKSFDTFCPLGPVIVTKDEIRDPNDLSI